MVENQQGIKTVLSFGAKSVDPTILEQLLVGRKKNAEFLYKAVDGIVHNGNNQQLLVIGQRGMGKTHLLRLLFHKCGPFIENGQLIVAYFSEEEYGVSSYFDFLTRILYAFIRWSDADKDLLNEQLEDLQNFPGNLQRTFLEAIITNYIGDKPLLILAENFTDILNGMGPQEQGKLRAWMYENKRISIIATSQSFSEDFDREDRPFYGFFQVYYLKPLSFDDSLNFLISLATLDNRPDVVEHLETKGKGQVKAIHELVKGNHRLLVTFYEFLKSDTLAKLSNHFIKTINDLKPYYETFIRYLPPQQQKILRYIALSRKPQQGTEIAKKCFIDQKTLSKQLSELSRKKLIEIIMDNQDKRNKLYDINEPLLRISIEVGEHKEGITALFVDFLALYYDEDELTKKKLRFSDLLHQSISPFERMNFRYELDAVEKALNIKQPDQLLRKLANQLFELYTTDNLKEGYRNLEAQKPLLGGNDYKFLLAYLYSMDNKDKNALELFPQIGKDYLHRRRAFTLWVVTLLQVARDEGYPENLLTECIHIIELALENGGEDKAFLHYLWGKALRYLANVRGVDQSLYRQSIDKLKIALTKDQNDADYNLELANSLVALSLASAEEKLFPDAQQAFASAFEHHQDNAGVLSLWGASMSYINDFFDHDILDSQKLKNALSALSAENRIQIWRNFSVLLNVPFLSEMFPILKTDLLANLIDLRTVIFDWINTILSHKLRSMTKVKIDVLRKIIQEITPQIPELAILNTYIDTYEEYALNGNPNSLLELPKEQRLFFQKNILRELQAS